MNENRKKDLSLFYQNNGTTAVSAPQVYHRQHIEHCAKLTLMSIPGTCLLFGAFWCVFYVHRSTK